MLHWKAFSCDYTWEIIQGRDFEVLFLGYIEICCILLGNVKFFYLVIFPDEYTNKVGEFSPCPQVHLMPIFLVIDNLMGRKIHLL